MKMPLPDLGSIARPLLASLALVVLCTGCASVDSAAFDQFAQGLTSLRDGVDAQAGADAAKAKTRFMNQVKSGKINVLDMQLDFTPPYAYKYAGGDEPLYIKLENFQQGLRSLNDAMISYAGLLAKLSGDEVVNAATFDKLANDLQASAASASDALDLGVKNPKLLSQAAIDIFRLIVKKKRRKELVAAIREVQPDVEDFSRAVQISIKALAVGVTTDYDDQINPIFQTLAQAGQNAKVSADTIEEILALNEKTKKTLGTLSVLSESYKRLPDAHGDLKNAANKKSGGLTGLIGFTNETIRLHKLYADLAANN